MKRSPAKGALPLFAAAAVGVAVAAALLWAFYFRPVDTLKQGLPTLAGQGRLPALHVAMARDKSLRAEVRAFCALDDTTLFFEREQTDKVVAAILLHWAGVDIDAPVDGKAPGGLHPHVDAFLRAAYDLGQTTPIAGNPLLGGDPWPRLFRHYKHRLMAQCAGAGVFEGSVTYDYERDRVMVQGWLSQGFLDRFAATLKIRPGKGKAVSGLLSYIDDVKGIKSLPDDWRRKLISLRGQ